MTTNEGEQVISSGCSTAGITNALKNGETFLEPLDLFADIEASHLLSKMTVICSKLRKVLFNISRLKMKRIPSI